MRDVGLIRRLRRHPTLLQRLMALRLSGLQPQMTDEKKDALQRLFFGIWYRGWDSNPQAR
ncbi:hypothetical protein FDX03_22200 [Citrobacter sp. wls827]|nr:hypothetical protein FDX03_22200 [Citrobacter sp. wls827]